MYVVFVGPKKTATTAVYKTLKQHHSKINLLPKESNILIQRCYREELNHKLTVDVSPQYFASYSALFNVFRMVRAGTSVKVVALKRDEDKRLVSHISYMMKKRELSSENVSNEFDTICMQNDVKKFTTLWKRVASSYHEFSIHDQDFKEFLSNLLQEQIDHIHKANEGGFIPRRGFLIAKFTAKALRSIGLHNFVEKISTSYVKTLLYRKEAISNAVDLEFEAQIQTFILNELQHEKEI